MREPDLIPADYRRQLQMRRWLVRFIPSFLVLLSLIAGARLVLDHELNNLRSDVASLEQERQRVIQKKLKVSSLEERKQHLQQRLELINGLRGGPPAKTIFRTVDRALDENVWFKKWSFRRAGEITSWEQKSAVETGYLIMIPQGQPTDPKRAWRLKTSMEISGQALNHTDLAALVQRLVAQPEIEDVKVLNSTLRANAQREVVDFDLAIVVNNGLAGSG